MSERNDDQASGRRERPAIPADMNEFNRKLISDFRATGGRMSGPMAGRSLLLLTTTGARSSGRVLDCPEGRHGGELRSPLAKPPQEEQVAVDHHVAYGCAVEPLRLAELLTGLSLVADIGMGLSPGEAGRAALVAVELAGVS